MNGNETGGVEWRQKQTSECSTWQQTLSAWPFVGPKNRWGSTAVFTATMQYKMRPDEMCPK